VGSSGNCELCEADGGEVLFRNGDYRVVLVDDAAYPGFCRVVWHEHVREMTSLTTAQRTAVMDAVWRVETALREVMQPDKINLASFGNMTPHVHWHVIPRFADDAHFPNPVWGEVRRTASTAATAARIRLLPRLREALVHHLTT
jgi:diadenosine tetraphosphate (Ap4A) HIT family hydrolase